MYEFERSTATFFDQPYLVFARQNHIERKNYV